MSPACEVILKYNLIDHLKTIKHKGPKRQLTSQLLVNRDTRLTKRHVQRAIMENPDLFVQHAFQGKPRNIATASLMEHQTVQCPLFDPN